MPKIKITRKPKRKIKITRRPKIPVSIKIPVFKRKKKATPKTKPRPPTLAERRRRLAVLRETRKS